MPTAYAIQEPVLYRINDLPDALDPYGKVVKDGPSALSMQELLSLAIGDTKRVTEYVQDYGMYSLTALHTVDEMSYALRLPQKDSVALLVSLELGKRLYGKAQGGMVTIKGIEDVYSHYRSMAALPKEQLRVLLINSRYQVVHEELLAVGSVESLHIAPRDVFQAAIERRVTAVLLVHNHPSGDSTPSKADYEFTQKVAEAARVLGVQLIDHVVISEVGYSSCMTKGK